MYRKKGIWFDTRDKRILFDTRERERQGEREESKNDCVQEFVVFRAAAAIRCVQLLQLAAIFLHVICHLFQGSLPFIITFILRK